MAFPHKNNKSSSSSAALAVVLAVAVLVATEGAGRVAGDDTPILPCTSSGRTCTRAFTRVQCTAYCKANVQGTLFGSCSDQAADGSWPCRCCGFLD